MNKLIFAATLLGFSSCIKKYEPKETSNYTCVTTSIYYNSINDEPLFSNPHDTGYTTIEYNIEDEDLERLMSMQMDCISNADTSIHTVPTSSTTSNTSTTVILTDWNKID